VLEVERGPRRHWEEVSLILVWDGGEVNRFRAFQCAGAFRYWRSKMIVMSDRTFTLDEAQSLLPVLESLLRTAIAGKKVMEEVEAEHQALAHRVFLNGGMFLDVVPLARRKAERIKAEQRAKDALAEIDSIGVQVKDLDIGLLDFPCEVEGQIILLCWKLGEKAIAHWHGTDEGFAGRKPVDERISRARKAN